MCLLLHFSFKIIIEVQSNEPVQCIYYHSIPVWQFKVPFNKKNATYSENKANSWKVFRSIQSIIAYILISYYM